MKIDFSFAQALESITGTGSLSDYFWAAVLFAVIVCYAIILVRAARANWGYWC